MKKNAILFSKIDREDGWVSLGLVFKVNNTSTYEDAYNEIKHKLETTEMIEFITKDRSLSTSLFCDEDYKEDKTYKFSHTQWRNKLCFVFTNDQEEEKEYKLSADFIHVID